MNGRLQLGPKFKWRWQDVHQKVLSSQSGALAPNHGGRTHRWWVPLSLVRCPRRGQCAGNLPGRGATPRPGRRVPGGPLSRPLTEKGCGVATI